MLRVDAITQLAHHAVGRGQKQIALARQNNDIPSLFRPQSSRPEVGCRSRSSRAGRTAGACASISSRRAAKRSSQVRFGWLSMELAMLNSLRIAGGLTGQSAWHFISTQTSSLCQQSSLWPLLPSSRSARHQSANVHVRPATFQAENARHLKATRQEIPDFSHFSIQGGLTRSH